MGKSAGKLTARPTTMTSKYTHARGLSNSKLEKYRATAMSCKTQNANKLIRAPAVLAVLFSRFTVTQARPKAIIQALTARAVSGVNAQGQNGMILLGTRNKRTPASSIKAA